jgi:hypothetical protein
MMKRIGITKANRIGKFFDCIENGDIALQFGNRFGDPAIRFKP